MFLCLVTPILPLSIYIELGDREMEETDIRGLIDGQYAFGVYAPSYEQALSEASHYASQYASEGKVTLQIKQNGRWKNLPVLKT